MIRRIPLAFYFSSALLYTQAGILPKSDSQPKPPSRLSPGTAVSYYVSGISSILFLSGSQSS